MIGVEGQYVFKFSIGGKKEFIDTDSLQYFNIYEECGNSLPAWEISFNTASNDLIGVFHEGNDFEVSYGVSIKEMDDIRLMISSKTINRVGEQKYRIEAKGILSVMEYITQPNIQITDKKSGIEAVKDVVEKYFEFDSNIPSSQDSQHWIQPNTTDKLFVNKVWIHSYVKGSFIGTAITLGNKFILRDMAKLVSGDYKFKFTPNIQSDKDIDYIGDFLLESRAGFINCWVGYGREKPVHTIESDEWKKVSFDPVPLMALSKTLSRRSSIEKRASAIGMQNDNTHKKYWEAANANITGLALFSSESNKLSFSGRFVDIRPLDLVMFKDSEPDSGSKSAEFHSGLYIVGRIGRSLSSSTFTTTLDLYRESFNAIKGELR
jgi:hypothetical protein